jgi:hypothetical protein
MTFHELFAHLPAPLAGEILESAHANDKQTYRAALQAVAQGRKLRPVFLERQPRSERHATMAASLKRPALEPAADALIRSWLLKKQSALLCEFLDTLKIPHDKGVVENLPETVNESSLAQAVETIVAKYPPEIVRTYLHAFHQMNEGKWTGLGALLEKDPRLIL